MTVITFDLLHHITYIFASSIVTGQYHGEVRLGLAAKNLRKQIPKVVNSNLSHIFFIFSFNSYHCKISQHKRKLVQVYIERPEQITLKNLCNLRILIALKSQFSVEMYYCVFCVIMMK